MTNKEKLEVIWVCIDCYTVGDNAEKMLHSDRCERRIISYIPLTHYDQKVKELDVACKALEALAKQSQKYAMFESMRIAQQALNQINKPTITKE
jgi:hypothetical protein